MKKSARLPAWGAIVWVVLLTFACGRGMPAVRIDRKPAALPASAFGAAPAAIPHYDAASRAQWQVDLRSKNLSTLDTQGSLADLLMADFDTRTTWPPPEKMPQGFDPRAVMDLGKDPGLGVRSVHALGITGKGVGIAIIEQPLIVDHKEYGDRLRLYEEINIPSDSPSQMLGPAVASIAVGKTVGTAPEADLYYIACTPGTWKVSDKTFEYDFSFLASAVRRVLAVNAGLPAGRKIRVISMSIGWIQNQKGYADITAAVKEAEAAGIFVVSSSLEAGGKMKFQALGREPMADPNAFESYGPGLWLAPSFFLDDPKAREYYAGRLWVPMDSRTTASPTGKDDYVFYREGGWSWCIPYIAGVYALACQADPSITPERFWNTALATGRTIKVERGGKAYDLGPILNVPVLMSVLKK